MMRCAPDATPFRWNRHKKKVNDVADGPFYYAREIWWCAVGVNVGNELDGTGKEHDRPVLVIRPFNAETHTDVRQVNPRPCWIPNCSEPQTAATL